MEFVATVAVVVLLAPFELFLGYFLGKKREQKEQEIALKTADMIIEDAQRVIESNQKVALLETKEKIRELELELQRKKDTEQNERLIQYNEIKLKEKELNFRESNLDKKSDGLTREFEALSIREAELARATKELVHQEANLLSEREKQLLELAQLSRAEAKELILSQMEQDLQAETSQMIRKAEEKARYQIKQKSKQLLIQTMQRYTAEVATERTVSVVNLPSDDLKGRLIGREGRNIRSIETLTGVDVIIDDTPEAIVLSCFDPIRREIARLLVQELVNDGRIHPGRIEEIYTQKKEELAHELIEIGEETLVEMNIPNMPEELLSLLGKLHFRTSYGQNILQHSKEVGFISGMLAAELEEDVHVARRAGLLHDIGKAVDFESEGTHIELGVKIAKKYREKDTVINAIASHHGDVPATSIIAEIVAIADGISATRPGARRESLELYIKRLADLEEITMSFDGVQKAFAIQAGREIRVMVNPDKASDKQANVLAREISKKIEATLQYPGTIKVTVIREVRAVEVAK